MSAPWRCRVCSQNNKSSAAYCPTCGGYWSKVMDRQGARPSQPPERHRDEAWWQPKGNQKGDQQRGKSPRTRRPRSPRQRGKGGQQPSQQRPEATTTAVPTTAQLPRPPKAKAVPTPKEVSGGATEPTAECQVLNQLIEQLGQAQELPDGVRALMAQIGQTTARTEARTLHRLVTQLADPVSWLDDIAVLLQSQSAKAAATDAARATALIYQYLSLIGVGLNLDQGKTEAIVSWHGPGAHDAKVQVMQKGAGSVPICVPGCTGLLLRCVLHYEHLGSLRTDGGDIGPAVEHRHREARSVYRAVKTRLLPNPNLTLAERQSMIHALILSRFLHGAGTWLFGSTESWESYVARYVGLLRGAIRPLHGCSSGRLSQPELCALTRALLPEEVLAVSRVRLLACIAHRGGRFARLQFAHHGAWILQLRSDVALVARVTEDTALKAYAEADLDAAAWIDAWPFNQGGTRALLARFRKLCVAGRCHLVEPAIARAHAHERIQQAGPVYMRDIKCSPRTLRFQCPDCPSVFTTRAAASAHRSKVHGHKSAAAQAFGTACEVCRRQFWSTGRLSEHFRKSARCAAIYRESDLAGTQAEVLADKRMPCSQLVGPQQWWATLDHPPLEPLVQPPSAIDPLPRLLALVQTEQLHSFFQLFACSVEAHGYDEVLAVLRTVPEGSDYWRLAVSVVSVLDSSNELHHFSEGALAAVFQTGALLYGPKDAVRSAVAGDWPSL
ncbi:unnamed protein product [Symbiodinium sp. CCMP2592]|nr:unnamed protein product [Symbiodinium sp. CCMP2592]